MAKFGKIIIGPGVGSYLALNRPDTKFDELGQYKADLILSEKDATPFITKIQKVAKGHLGKALPKTSNTVFEQVMDEDGEPTGDIRFKIRVKNRMNKLGKVWDRRPLIIDAKKQPVAEDVLIYGGSVLKVQAEIYTWEYSGKKGMSLQPLVVQVIELKTGSGSVDTADFDEEEGYISEGPTGSLSDFDVDESDDGDDSDY